MSPSLQQELRQSKPFSSLQQEAYLSVVRTTSMLTDQFEDLLKPHGITGTQFNGFGTVSGCQNLVSSLSQGISNQFQHDVFVFDYQNGFTGLCGL